MVSTLYGFTGAWGINEFKVILKRCHGSCGTCVGPNSCTTCNTGLTLSGLYCDCKGAGKRVIR